ncbi:MAG: RDD family protein [Verrucomicrobiota bacterium]
MPAPVSISSPAQGTAWSPEGAALSTPEQVDLRLELGNVGSRGLAVMLDFAIRYGAIVLLYLIMELVTDFDRFSTELGWPERTYALFFIIFFFVNEWFYFTIFEWVWNGQTPGKRVLGLRVIKIDGSPPTWMEVVLRNFLRPIDTSGPFALIGIIFIFFHPLRQRPGDIVGQTVVVRERAVDWELLGHEAPEAPRPIRLSPEEWELLHRYQHHGAQLEAGSRGPLAGQIRRALEPAVARSGVKLEADNDEAWLREAARQS